MAKQKIKRIFRKFLSDANPADTKKTIREMYDFIMLSDEEISPEQRQDFTLTCYSVEKLMDDVSSVSKKMLRKKKVVTG